MRPFRATAPPPDRRTEATAAAFECLGYTVLPWATADRHHAEHEPREPAAAWHALAVDDALAQSGVDPTTGLDRTEVAAPTSGSRPERAARGAPATRLAHVCAAVQEPADLHPVRRRGAGGGARPPRRRGGDHGRGAGQRADRRVPGRPRRALDGRAATAVPAAGARAARRQRTGHRRARTGARRHRAAGRWRRRRQPMHD